MRHYRWFILFALFLGGCDEASLQISGLSSYQVIQRDSEGSGTIHFSGHSPWEGTLEGRLLQGGAVLIDWHAIATIEQGEFKASWPDIATGGEYSIELRMNSSSEGITPSLKFDHILVGDNWVLAGQSNMVGEGELDDLEASSPLVHLFDLADQWLVAKDPLFWPLESVDPGHWWEGYEDPLKREISARGYRSNRSRGAGLGLSFAKEVVRMTGVPIGLITAAKGGSSLADWDPARRSEGGRSLYGALIRKSFAAGGVRGILWYQGESDAGESSQYYLNGFEKLVSSVRRDLHRADLPFYFVQLGKKVVSNGSPEGWNRVREAQRIAANTIAASDLTTAVDLDLIDDVHVNGEGLKRVGRRLAKVVSRDLYQIPYESGPRLSEISISADRKRVSILYEGVNGGLAPVKDLCGFSIRNLSGDDLKLISESFIDSQNRKRVILKLSSPLSQGDQLWYGYGFYPCANLTDEEDLAALAFGPLPLQ